MLYIYAPGLRLILCLSTGIRWIHVPIWQPRLTLSAKEIRPRDHVIREIVARGIERSCPLARFSSIIKDEVLPRRDTEAFEKRTQTTVELETKLKYFIRHPTAIYFRPEYNVPYFYTEAN